MITIFNQFHWYMMNKKENKIELTFILYYFIYFNDILEVIMNIFFKHFKIITETDISSSNAINNLELAKCQIADSPTTKIIIHFIGI